MLDRHLCESTHLLEGFRRKNGAWLVAGIHRQYLELVDLKLRLQGAIDTSVMSTLKERARCGNPMIECRVAMMEAEVYFETNNRTPVPEVG